MNKQQKMFHISLCIFSLEASKGHLKWKVTELVRSSGVSRTLVYRYFGNTKKNILLSAIDVFCNVFYEFDGEPSELDFAARIQRARKQMVAHSEAILFYQKWRAKDSHLQKKFIEIEEKFRAKLKAAFPGLTSDEIVLLHTCIHGLVTAPFLTPQQAGEILAEMNKKKIFLNLK